MRFRFSAENQRRRCPVESSRFSELFSVFRDFLQLFFFSTTFRVGLLQEVDPCELSWCRSAL